MFVQIVAVLSLVGALITLASLVALHVLPTGLSPVRDPVSAYGISRYRALYRAQTLGTALSAGALAAAFAAAILGATLAVVFLAVLAVARAVISWFPMDAPHSPRTGTGRLHNLLAYAAFAAASVSGFMVGIAFAGESAYAPFASAASVLGWIMTAASALTILGSFVPALKPVFGLAERLIYAGMLALLALGAVALVVV